MLGVRMCAEIAIWMYETRIQESVINNKKRIKIKKLGCGKPFIGFWYT